MGKICGIYKITSPTGKVYIGQSMDIKRRWGDYRSLNCKKQRRLFYSLNKYGHKKHEFNILAQCKPEMLNELELFYIDLFESLGKDGLNSMRGTKWTKSGKAILRKSRMGFKKANSLSKYIGVSKNKYNRYTVEFSGLNNEHIYLGTYNDEVSAAYNHDMYCKENPILGRVLNFTDIQLENLKGTILDRNKIETTSKYNGIHKHKDGGYIAQLPPSSNRRYIGLFKDEVSAAYKYDLEIIKRGLDKTLLNFTDKERCALKCVVLEKNPHRVKSRYKGIYVNKKTGRWASRIGVNSKKINLGSYETDNEAAQAYNNYVIKHKLNRKLNVIK